MQEKNKSNWSTPLFYAFLVIMGVVIGVFIKGEIPLGNIKWHKQDPMQEMLQLIQSKYVDSVDGDSASTHLANFYLAQLDPHSVYIFAQFLPLKI